MLNSIDNKIYKRNLISPPTHEFSKIHLITFMRYKHLKLGGSLFEATNIHQYILL